MTEVSDDGLFRDASDESFPSACPLAQTEFLKNGDELFRAHRGRDRRPLVPHCPSPHRSISKRSGSSASTPSESHSRVLSPERITQGDRSVSRAKDLNNLLLPVRRVLHGAPHEIQAMTIHLHESRSTDPNRSIVIHRQYVPSVDHDSRAECIRFNGRFSRNGSNMMNLPAGGLADPPSFGLVIFFV